MSENHLVSVRTREGILELAAILARGYLRLTDKAPVVAVSHAAEGDKELDVLRRESPDVVTETAPWKRACSAKSTASEA